MQPKPLKPRLRVTTKKLDGYQHDAAGTVSWFDQNDAHWAHGSARFDQQTLTLNRSLLEGGGFTRDEAVELLTDLKELAERRLAEFESKQQPVME